MQVLVYMRNGHGGFDTQLHKFETEGMPIPNVGHTLSIRDGSVQHHYDRIKDIRHYVDMKTGTFKLEITV